MRVLVFYDYFTPAFKAGGPIRSLDNLVQLSVNKMEYLIITTNQDHDLYILDVPVNQWTAYSERCQVAYLNQNSRNLQTIEKLIQDIQIDLIYINGIFSSFTTISPLRLAKKYSLPVLIAPRGMLQQGALSIKPFKKKIYLFLIKHLYLNRIKHLGWHATDEQEKKDILNYSSSYNKTWVVGNAPTFTPNFLPKTHKVDLPIRLVTISLIAPKKNHLWFIQILKNSNITTPLAYDIYGPADQEYLSLLKQQIKKLPKNITVNIYSAIKPSEVQRTLQNYHYFILPTKGENFGHAIFEAVNVGTPVIISPHTPWNGLQNKQAGWDIPLEENQWQSTINHAISLNQQEYQNLQSGARKIAENYMKNVDLKSQYQTMFESASKCE